MGVSREGALKRRRMLLLIAVLSGGATGADDYYQQMGRLKALDSRCEQARLEKLAPIRQRLIDQCIKEARKYYTGQDCQNEYVAYGNSTVGPNSNLIRGQYYDLPECVEAARAWIEWEASQP